MKRLLGLQKHTANENLLSKLMKKCPCQSGQNYNICCRRYHLGKIHAPTAEALMRSRYSAYLLIIPRYIFKTWHSETRPSIEELRKSPNQKFVGLTIIDTELGMDNDEIGSVTFIVTFEEDGQLKEYQEKSSFKREKNKWVYYHQMP